MTMTKHACPRCGLESSHDTWAERHPAAAVTAGLFTLVWTSMMLSVYAIAALTMIALACVGGVGYWTIRERRRREALVARAEWEHRAVMAAPVPAVKPLSQRQALSLPWQMASMLRTEPLRSGRYRA